MAVAEGARDVRVDLAVCPPFVYLVRGGRGAQGQPRGARRAEHVLRAEGRLHRRGQRRHAQGRRLPLRDPRPLRAAPHPRREGRTHPRQGPARRSPRGLDPILCVGETLEERDANRTLAVDRAPGARGTFRHDRRAGAPRDDRLRAGLGHRHRPQRHARAGAGSPRRDPQTARGALRRGRGRGDPHPVRRLGEAGKRARHPQPAGRGRRAGRRREPQGRFVPGHRARGETG